MKRKKILYVVTKSVWGGAQKYVYDLATNLPKDRFETVVVAGGSGLLFDALQKAGIRTITIPVLQRDVSIFKEVISLWHLLKIFTNEKPEIIHLNSTKVGGLGAIAAKLSSLVVSRKSLVIFTVHGWGFNEDRSLAVRAVIFLISWFSSLFQDKIICINTADFKTAQKFIPRRKITLIFNGIGPVNFLPREEARAFLEQITGREITKSTILIGTNAELTRNKGLTYLIGALQKLQATSYKLQTVIIGDGEDHQKLKNQIKLLDLQNNVLPAGFIPDAARYLKAFDVFLLPSLKEGLPYTIMEAMAAGLPIIATNVGGIPDLIEHKKTGLLVSPKDTVGLAEKMQTIIQNKLIREEFGSLARETIKTKFQLHDMIVKTVVSYDRP